MSTLTYNSSTITLTRLPLRRPISERLPQLSGRKSSGLRIAYGHGAQRTIIHNLAWSWLPEAQVAALFQLYAAVGGARRAFLWVDDAAISRTVKFNSPISSREVGPGRYAVEFSVVQEVAL